jgi:hypothetical protein
MVFGTIEPVTLNVPGAHTDLLQVAHDAWDEWSVPRELLPICEDNANFYCISESGEVCYWSHDGAGEERWPDLASWIEDVWLTSA